MSFSPFNWIRDLFGIRKDLIEAEKLRAEIEKIESEIEKIQDDQSERHLISRPTLEQTEFYDPKIQILKDKILRREAVIERSKQRELITDIVFAIVRAVLFIELIKALLRQT